MWLSVPLLYMPIHASFQLVAVMHGGKGNNTFNGVNGG